MSNLYKISSISQRGKYEPFDLQVSRGQIANHTPFNLFGYGTTGTTAPKDIRVRISTVTGLITAYTADGVSLLDESASCPMRLQLHRAPTDNDRFGYLRRWQVCSLDREWQPVPNPNYHPRLSSPFANEASNAADSTTAATTTTATAATTTAGATAVVTPVATATATAAVMNSNSVSFLIPSNRVHHFEIVSVEECCDVMIPSPQHTCSSGDSLLAMPLRGSGVRCRWRERPEKGVDLGMIRLMKAVQSFVDDPESDRYLLEVRSMEEEVVSLLVIGSIYNVMFITL